MRWWISIPAVALLLASPCAGTETCCLPPEHPESACLPGLALDETTGRCEPAVRMTAAGTECPKGHRAEASQEPMRGSVEWGKGFVRCVQDASPQRSVERAFSRSTPAVSQP